MPTNAAELAACIEDRARLGYPVPLALAGLLKRPDWEDVVWPRPGAEALVLQEGSWERLEASPQAGELRAWIASLSHILDRAIDDEGVFEAAAGDVRVTAHVGLPGTSSPHLVVRRLAASDMAASDWASDEPTRRAVCAFVATLASGGTALVVGPSGSGKTTFLGCALRALAGSADVRIVSIEDQRELNVPGANWTPLAIPSSTRLAERGPHAERLVAFALRERPDVLAFGELRGPEASALFSAAASGHAVAATMHAHDLRSALARLRSPPLCVPSELLAQLDLVVRLEGRGAFRRIAAAEVPGGDGEAWNLLDAQGGSLSDALLVPPAREAAGLSERFLRAFGAMSAAIPARAAAAVGR